MTSVLTLKYPVYTLDNRLLFPADTELSSENINVLISSNSTTPQNSYNLMCSGSIKSDLLNFFKQPPYDFIFASQKKIAEIIDLMETVKLPLSILQSLEYFKQNDLYTYRHTLIVFVLTTLLTKDLISDYKSLMHGIATGPTHDLGKICVPLNILKKSVPLTLDERGILENHTAAGFVLLSYYLQDENNPGAEVARDHHERKNGSGYPRGIQLNDRLVEIIAVCDVYDALISLRPYRPISYDNRTALEEITKMAERNEIGWDVVKALIAHNRQNKPHYKEVKVSMEKRGTPPPGNVYGSATEQKNNAQE